MIGFNHLHEKRLPDFIGQSTILHRRLLIESLCAPGTCFIISFVSLINSLQLKFALGLFWEDLFWLDLLIDKCLKSEILCLKQIESLANLWIFLYM